MSIQAGEYSFTCRMRIFRGVIEVKECNLKNTHALLPKTTPVAQI
jgi:plastocyanin domain-containing protein